MLIARLMSSYRALGWHAQPEETKRDMKAYTRRRSDWHMKVGVNANRLQSHFRPQVIF